MQQAIPHRKIRWNVLWQNYDIISLRVSASSFYGLKTSEKFKRTEQTVITERIRSGHTRLTRTYILRNRPCV